MVQVEKTNAVLRHMVRAFPPPRFLSMPAAAIDISNTSIKYMDATYSAAGLIPNNFVTVPLPEGTIVAGAIKKPKTLIEVLRKLRKQHKRTFVFASLPEEPAYLFPLKVPHTDETHIREAVEVSLGESVPVTADNAIFDYNVITTEGDNTRVSVTVYERKLIEAYSDALTRSGFELRALELESESIARSVIPEGIADISMIIDMGRDRTGIIITQGQTPIFTTTVHIGGDTITQAIMEHSHASHEDAEKIKLAVDLTSSEDEDMQKVVNDTLKKLVNEINRHYTFWDTRRDKHGDRVERIDSIYLCGGAAAFAGLQQYLSKELRVPVVPTNVWQNLLDINSYVPQISKSASWQYATVVGLLSRDLIV